MSTTPDTIALGEEYSRSIEEVYQQKTSQLISTVDQTDQEAESQFKHYIGTIDFLPITTKYGETILQDVEHSRRRIAIEREAAGVPLDDEDDLRSVSDLGGPYMEGLYNGAGRLVDKWIYEGLGGYAYAGKRGLTQIANYDVGECALIAGDGTAVTAGSDHSNTTATALTAAKMEGVKTLFTNSHVPYEDRHMLVNEYNVMQLMRDNSLSTEEKIALRNIKEGKVERFMSFNFHVMADDFFTVNTAETDCIECYAWQKKAMIHSKGRGRRAPEVFFGRRPDKNYMKQFWAQMYGGAWRLRGPGVVEILLKKSA